MSMPANLVLGNFFRLQTADFSLCPCLVERGPSIPLPLLRSVIHSKGLHLHGWSSSKAPPPNTITQGRVHQYLIHNSPLSTFRFSFSTRCFFLVWVPLFLTLLHHAGGTSESPPWKSLHDECWIYTAHFTTWELKPLIWSKSHRKQAKSYSSCH